MQTPEELALKILYLDRCEALTLRVVSPVRWLDHDRFLAICLCRQEPRQFYLHRCLRSYLVPAHDVLAPEAIRRWDLAQG